MSHQIDATTISWIGPSFSQPSPEERQAAALEEIAKQIARLADVAQRIADQGEQYEDGEEPGYQGQSLSDVPR